MDEKTLEFECVGLAPGGKFPVQYTGRGKDCSPAFVLHDLSPKAKTLVITLEDLSHPIKGFTHWVIWNIPATSEIPGAIPKGKTVPQLGDAMQGVGYGLHRYAGPKPPRGKSHQYCFTVYALDCRLDLKASASKRKVLRSADGHVLQQGKICGYFE